MMRIENWSIGCRANQFTAPNRAMKISGNIYGHPKFAEGARITTSVILLVNAVSEIVITSSRSEYELGLPHPDYEKEFPNARARFFKGN